MTDRIKPCPLCGAKLTKDRWGIYEHEANDCILAYYEVYDEDLDKWNTRKPMGRIVERLKEYQRNYSSGLGGFTDELIDRVLRNAIEIVKEGGKK